MYAARGAPFIGIAEVSETVDNRIINFSKLQKKKTEKNMKRKDQRRCSEAIKEDIQQHEEIAHWKKLISR